MYQWLGVYDDKLPDVDMRHWTGQTNLHAYDIGYDVQFSYIGYLI